MQPDLEHLQEHEPNSPDYLDRILAMLANKAGVREDDEKRQSFRSVLHDSRRKKDETLFQYAVRRERDFNRAANFGMQIPDGFKVTLLREGALLSEQTAQNLTTLLQGRDDDPAAVARALSKLDARSDRLIGFAQDAGPGQFYQDEPEPSSEEESPEAEMTEDDEILLAELDGMNLDEGQVKEVFAILDHKKDPKKKRSWKENKMYKAEARKDRGSLMKSGRAAAPRGKYGGVPGQGPPKRPSRRKMNRDQLKKITKCKVCGKKGHWAEDCNQNAPSSSSKLQAFSYTAKGSQAGTTLGSGFSFLTRKAVQRAIQQVLQRQHDQMSFLTVPNGEAILDIGAAQDLIGSSAAESLAQKLGEVGLKVIPADVTPTVPSGIGGPARVKETLLVPISPGGGVIAITVLEADIPPLLSVGLLEHLRACIDLHNDKITFKEISVDLAMNRIESGHRTIPLVKWPGGIFPIPKEIREKFDVQDGAFNLDSTASLAYMSAAATSVTTRHETHLVSRDHVVAEYPPCAAAEFT